MICINFIELIWSLLFYCGYYIGSYAGGGILNCFTPNHIFLSDMCMEYAYMNCERWLKIINDSRYGSYVAPKLDISYIQMCSAWIHAYQLANKEY